MIVCHCHAVSDNEIRRVAAEVGRDCHGVQSRCGAGTACRTCLPAIQAVLRTLDARREPRGPQVETRP